MTHKQVARGRAGNISTRGGLNTLSVSRSLDSLARHSQSHPGDVSRLAARGGRHDHERRTGPRRQIHESYLRSLTRTVVATLNTSVPCQCRLSARPSIQLRCTGASHVTDLPHLPFPGRRQRMLEHSASTPALLPPEAQHSIPAIPDSTERIGTHASGPVDQPSCACHVSPAALTLRPSNRL